MAPARARETSEEGREARVGALGDVAVARDELLRRAVVEARVGAEEPDERVEAPGEARVGHHAIHLASDPCHLAKADVVDLLRRARRRRVPLRVVGVERGPVRQRAGGDVLTRRRQVRVAQEYMQLLDRGDDAVAVSGDGACGEAFTVGLGDAGRPGAEPGEHPARHRVVDDERGDLGGDVTDGDTRRRHAGVEAGLEQRDCLRDERRHGLEPRRAVLVVLHRGRGHQRQRARDVLLHAFELVQRHPQVAGDDAADGHRVVVEVEPTHGGVEHLEVEVVVEARRGVEAARVHRAVPREALAQIGVARVDRGRGVVGPPIVVAGIPEARGGLRVLAHPVRPVLRVLHAQRVGDGRGGRDLGAAGGYGGQAQKQDGAVDGHEGIVVGLGPPRRRCVAPRYSHPREARHRDRRWRDEDRVPARG